MATIIPFRGIRYNPDKIKNLADVVTPPYDVIDAAAQDRYYRKHPYNIIRLEYGKIFDGDGPGDNRYTRAAAFYRDWLKENVLVQEKDRALYLYEQEFTAGGIWGRCGGGLGSRQLLIGRGVERATESQSGQHQTGHQQQRHVPALCAALWQGPHAPRRRRQRFHRRRAAQRRSFRSCRYTSFAAPRHIQCAMCPCGCVHAGGSCMARSKCRSGGRHAAAMPCHTIVRSRCGTACALSMMARTQQGGEGVQAICDRRAALPAKGGRFHGRHVGHPGAGGTCK
ncbi:MAG: DUF1015 domain-containing protein [Pirellulales bacterium]|nr:DUF1015 domain-containing protein [Pirellulales bacterium]